MKVALIADAGWIAQEQSTLRRLVVGLVDETVRVVRVAPEAVHESIEHLLIGTEQLWYRTARWSWMRDRSLRKLAGPMAEMEIDVLHVLDGSLQSIGVRLAQELDIPVICSVWSASEASHLHAHYGSVTGAYAAPTRGIVDLVKQRVGPAARVQHIPPGTYATGGEPENPPLSRLPEMLCCLVVGNGRYDAYYESLLRSIARMREQLAGVMFFFYTTEADQHQIWQAAEAMDLLEEISLVPVGSDSRRLLMQTDVVLQPQPMGAMRTVVLDALASARPLIAMEDPLTDHLIADQTAFILREHSVEAWNRVLDQLLAQPDHFVNIGRKGREYVHAHHKASTFVARCLDLYHQVAEPQPLQFAHAS